MSMINDYKSIIGVPELIALILIGLIYLPLMIYVIIASIVDYRVLKEYYLKKQKWGLNISCGPTNGGGINADVVPRNVPNFALIKNIYNLPFKRKQFKNIICSHTIEHVENPDKFYKELKRVSENVVLLVPPLWDFSGLGYFRGHKWQFLTLKIKHVNTLPKRFKLPYWWYQRRFGQHIGS